MPLSSPVHTVLYTNKRLMTTKEFTKNKPEADIQPGEGIFVLYLGYFELVTKFLHSMISTFLKQKVYQKHK